MVNSLGFACLFVSCIVNSVVHFLFVFICDYLFCGCITSLLGCGLFCFCLFGFC